MLTAIPTLLAVSPLIGYFIGTRIDRWLGTSPIFMFVFLALGLAAGVRETASILKKAQEPDDEPND